MSDKMKIEPCPFCGQRCVVLEFSGGYSVECMSEELLDDGWCAYSARVLETKAEAIAAHNRLAVAARLFPRACELLKAVEDGGRDPEESLEAWGRSVAYDKWTDQRDDLLAESESAAGGGQRSVMENPEVRGQAFRALAHVASRCDDPRAPEILVVHAEDFARRCALVDLHPEIVPPALPEGSESDGE